jgi:hypothetical protein
MKLLPEKLGAEPKKLAVLVGLIVLLGVVYFINSSSGPSTPVASTAPAAGSSGTPAPRATVAQTQPLPATRTLPRNATMRRGEGSITDFKPSFKLPEDIEVSRIDPSLHLDAIAKLRGVPLEGGQRSLFDFGLAPKPAAPPPPVQPIKPAPLPAAAVDPNAPPPAPVKPPPPPIPLKFYGYVNGSVGNSRQAFFLEGDEIFVAGENDLIHNRYRVIRIGVNSAVVEDTSNKNQQTLPLVEELPG